MDEWIRSPKQETMEDSEKLYLGVDFSTQKVYFYDSLFWFTFPVMYVLCNIDLIILWTRL